MPKNGFPVNKIVIKQLEIHLNTMDTKFSQFNDARMFIGDLNRDFKYIESLHNDPTNYILEYFSEIHRQVDLRKEHTYMCKTINKFQTR